MGSNVGVGVGGGGGGGELLLMMMMMVCLSLCALVGSSPAPISSALCGDLGPGECMARASMCKMVNKLGHGPGGPVKGVFDCAKMLGIPKMQVIVVLGPAFNSGHPETIVDRVIPNNTAKAKQFRRCVLFNDGLLTLNGSLAREAIKTKLLSKGVFTHPAIIDTVAAGITHCPEPEDLKLTQFLNCVKATCIQLMPPGLSALPMMTAAKGGGGDDDDDDDDDD